LVKKLLENVDRRIGRILYWGAIGCLIVLFVAISGGVFSRFVPFMSMGWFDEIVEFAFAWMIFLGVAALWRERSHFFVEMILKWLSSSSFGPKLEISLHFLSLVFLLVFTYEGVALTSRVNETSAILEIPKASFYIVMPIAGFLMVGYTLRDLWLLFHGRASLSGDRRINAEVPS
jgi:TRAP-type C4-dicarboxylate transport system permease small subunit